MSALPRPAVESRVLAQPPLDTAEMLEHLRRTLRAYTDPADLAEDLAAGVPGIVVVDARRPDAYARGHIPGALNLPHRTITAASTATLDRDALYVTYCDGIGCNGSTKGALALAALGFRVKELIGGIDWWVRDGLPLATADAPAPETSTARCAC